MENKNKRRKIVKKENWERKVSNGNKKSGKSFHFDYEWRNFFYLFLIKIDTFSVIALGVFRVASLIYTISMVTSTDIFLNKIRRRRIFLRCCKNTFHTAEYQKIKKWMSLNVDYWLHTFMKISLSEFNFLLHFFFSLSPNMQIFHFTFFFLFICNSIVRSLLLWYNKTCWRSKVTDWHMLMKYSQFMKT